MKTYDKPDVNVSRWWWCEGHPCLFCLNRNGDLYSLSRSGDSCFMDATPAGRWLPAVPPTFPERQKAAVRFGTARLNGKLVGIEWTSLNHQSATVTWLHSNAARNLPLSDLTDIEWFTPEYLEET